MVNWVWADGKSCIVCILGSGERRLFTVVSVTCLKSIPCYFFETPSVTVTCAEHRAGNDCTITTKCMCRAWDLLLQEHLTSFIKSSGARGCHWEELSEKEFWIHLPMTIEMLLDPSRPIWLQNIPQEFHLNMSAGHIFIERVIC